MTDRELLELAAKAEGHEYPWYEAHCGQMMEWNPLKNDLFALRLAVKLRLVIQHAPKYVVVMDVDRNIAEHQDTRENEGDAYRATRRAIVRAAAELGR